MPHGRRQRERRGQSKLMYSVQCLYILVCGNAAVHLKCVVGIIT